MHPLFHFFKFISKYILLSFVAAVGLPYFYQRGFPFICAGFVIIDEQSQIYTATMDTWQEPPIVDGCSNRANLTWCVDMYIEELCADDPVVARDCARICGYCQPPRSTDAPPSTLTSSAPPPCKDELGTCLSLALAGSCQVDSPRIRADCAFTCGYCNKPFAEVSIKECFDLPSKSFCENLRKQGRCEKSSPFFQDMLMRCPSTCNVCKEIEQFFLVEREALTKKWRTSMLTTSGGSEQGSVDYLSDDENASPDKLLEGSSGQRLANKTLHILGLIIVTFYFLFD